MAHFRQNENCCRLDCAFNNAGVGGGGPTHKFPEEDWDRIININLKGAWLCLKYEISQMLEQGGGVIVNNSSGFGLSGGGGGVSAYVASKHGVVGLTKSTALEYAKLGIRVNAICPGIVRTPMHEKALNDPERRALLVSREPMGRIGEPEEVADAAVWLCSDASSFITGIAMSVDGGWGL